MPADFKTFQDGDIVLVEGGDLDKDVKFDTDTSTPPRTLISRSS